MTGCTKDDVYALAVTSFPNRIEDFTLWQLEQFNDISQMGYILRTDDDRIIVVDGGDPGSAEFLSDYILQLGGTVHHWVLTHPHKDHVGVINHLLSRKMDITIEQVIHTRLDLELVRLHEPASFEYIRDFYNLLESSAIPITEPSVGDSITLGEGVALTVLGIRNPGIVVNLVNNSSLVFQVSSKSKQVLFTGDLGVEGGEALLRKMDVSALRSTHVQMAHHGQGGVSKNFYAAVEAQVALWPTPRWLWENNIEAKGLDTGPWKTLVVKAWMDELNIKRHIVAGIEGTIQID